LRTGGSRARRAAISRAGFDAPVHRRETPRAGLTTGLRGGGKGKSEPGRDDEAEREKLAEHRTSSFKVS
jgi:hypothetical protein